MSGQLGNLVVSLSADIARFREDMGKAARVSQDSAKQMSDHFKSVESAIGLVGKATALLAGGAMFKGTIDKTMEVAGEVRKLSSTLGITAEQASVLRIGLDDAFISVDDFATASSKLTKTLVKSEDAIKALGVQTRDNNGNFRSTTDIMAETNSKLMEFREGTDRNVEGMKIYGKGWDEARKTLKLTAQGLEEAEERAERLHLVMGSEGLRAAKEYKQAVKDIDDVAESFKVQIGVALIKPLTEVTVAFGDAGVAAANFFAKSLESGLETTKELAMNLKFIRDLASLKMEGGVFYDKPGVRAERELRRQAIIDQYNEDVANMRNPSSHTPADSEESGKRSKGGLQSDEAAKAAAQLAAYTEQYNKLQDARMLSNPWLDEEAKGLMRIRFEYDALIRKYPEHVQALKKDMQIEAAHFTNSLKAKDTIEKAKKDIAEFLKTAWDGAEQQLAAESFSADATKNMKMFNTKIPGATKNPAFNMGVDTRLRSLDEITAEQKAADEKLAIEDRYNTSLLSMKMSAAEQGLSIIQQTAKEGSAIAIGALVAQKALAVAQILINSEVAASAALLPPPVGLGPVLGMGLAASIRGMGYVSAGLAIASGAIELGQTVSGKRALGGPVSAGKTYLVGEKGPELFTPGSDGGITPNHKLGGSTYAPVFQIDARNSSISASEFKSIVKTATDASKSAILNSMNRGGEFALASGRMR
jgi:hypothetical protein